VATPAKGGGPPVVDEAVRDGLGQIGGPAAAATEPLMRALKDEDREVRRQAAQALARIVAGTKPSSAATSEPRSLTPPVPIDAPPPAFPK